MCALVLSQVQVCTSAEKVQSCICRATPIQGRTAGALEMIAHCLMCKGIGVRGRCVHVAFFTCDSDGVHAGMTHLGDHKLLWSPLYCWCVLCVV